MLEPAHQLFVGQRAARASRPATSTRRSTRRSTTSTRSTAAIPTAGSSAARQTQPAATRRSTTSRISCSARATATRSSTRSSPTCVSGCTSATCRTTCKVGRKLTLNLGLRYEFATPQWEKDNFLTNFDPATNTLIQAKDGSIYDRALVNPDRNNFAPRVGLAFAVDGQDRDPLRLRHELHPLQSHGRRKPALVQRSARRRRQHHAAAVAGAVRSQPARRRPASGRRSRDIRKGSRCRRTSTRSTSRVNYIPKDNPTRQRPELARVGAARAAARTCWSTSATSATRARDIMILGDYNQARPNGPTRTRRCRRAGRFRASRRSRRRGAAARATTTRCSSRSNGGTRAASTC